MLECICPCGLAGKPIQPTAPKDPILMLVGEGPGRDEVSYRQFFVGKTGQELTNYLTRVGIPRDRVYITNVIKCRTSEDNRDPKVDEIACCEILLLQEVEKVKPRLVVATGRFAARWFLGDVDMEQVHGLPFRTGKFGYPMIVVPVYHPALGLHDSTNMSIIMADFQGVKDTLTGKITPRVLGGGEYEGRYEVWDGNPSDLASPIAIDTETEEEDKAWSVQFSSRAGCGLFISAGDAPLLRRLGDFVADPSIEVILHNALFDIPVLNTLDICPMNYVDTMVMAYLLQTEPQGLKPLAFRHLGIKMNSYEDLINPRTQEMAIEYLEQVLTVDWPKVDPIVEINGMDVKVRQPQTLNTRAKRIITDIAKGVEVNAFDRWNTIEIQEGRGLSEALFGPLRQAYLKDVDFPVALRYACQDPDATFQIYPILAEKIAAFGLEEVLRRDMRMLPMVADMQKNGFQVDIPYMLALSKEFAESMDQLLVQIVGMVGDLNPGSDPQVFELLRRIGLERRPKMYKGATDHARLESLVGKHGVIDLIAQWRGYKKLKSSFLDVLPEKARSDGRVHTTLRITRVVTGRLSSSKPNLMAQPVRTEDGRKIRGGFVAGEGYSLVSGDYSQVEMRAVAHMSQDPVMMDIFRSGKDIHAETASRMFGVPIDQLDEMQHRYPAKRVGFGILNLISAGKLLREMEVGGAKGWTEAKCQRMIYDWFALYQGVRDWIEEQKIHARRYGFVRDMWGRVRLAPELLSVHKSVVEAGIRQSVNAPIQMSAQGIIKEAMGQLVPIYRSFGDEMRPLIQIHDDLLFECKDELVPAALAILREVMEGAAPSMSVPLRVDFKVGKRWDSMEKVKGENYG